MLGWQLKLRQLMSCCALQFAKTNKGGLQARLAGME
jgi:hypothetical protein